MVQERERQQSVGAKRRSLSDSEDTDSEDNGHGRRRKGRKKHPFVAKPKALPDWTKDGVIEHVVPYSQDTILIIVSAAYLQTRKARKVTMDAAQILLQLFQLAAQRERLWNLVVTKSSHLYNRVQTYLKGGFVRNGQPCECHIILQKYCHRLQVREHLNMSPTKPKYTYVLTDSDDDDNDDLPPAIAALKATAKKNVLARKQNGNALAAMQVTIKIRLNPHPENESGTTKVYGRDMSNVRSFAIYTCFRNSEFTLLFRRNLSSISSPRWRMKLVS